LCPLNERDERKLIFGREKREGRERDRREYLLHIRSFTYTLLEREEREKVKVRDKNYSSQKKKLEKQRHTRKRI